MIDPFRSDPNPDDVSNYTACRDSRRAFGNRFQIDEGGGHHWLWTAAAVVALLAVAAGWIAYRSAV